jgi:hypothetical protein
MEGNVMPCCRTATVLGNLGSQPLATIWHGEAAVRFRSQVSDGVYPAAECERCHADGKATTLGKVFDALIARHWEVYAQACAAAARPPAPALCEAIAPFHDYVRHVRHNGERCEPGRRLVGAIFAARRETMPADARGSLRQLAKVARACVDFAERRLRPRLVATMRQVNLVATCNARCVHCIGLHTGEIVHGVPTAGGRRKRMEPQRADAALANARSMTAFFMNGSELLLHPGWPALIRAFARRRVLLSFATNGMLLTPEGSRLLVASNVLRDVNFSFDGASARTVERIRGNVRFATLLTCVRSFLDEVVAAQARLPISLSMVLLADNVAEAADLVRLADDLRGGRDLAVHVSFQVLDPGSDPGYRAFVERQKVDIHEPRARRHLQEAAAVGRALGVVTMYTYAGDLDQALSASDPHQAMPQGNDTGRRTSDAIVVHTLPHPPVALPGPR